MYSNSTGKIMCICLWINTSDPNILQVFGKDFLNHHVSSSLSCESSFVLTGKCSGSKMGNPYHQRLNMNNDHCSVCFIYFEVKRLQTRFVGELHSVHRLETPTLDPTIFSLQYWVKTSPKVHPFRDKWVDWVHSNFCQQFFFSQCHSM